MTIYGWVIVGLWLSLVAYWGLSARARWRRTGSQWIWWREFAVRLCFFALILQVLRVAIFGNVLPNERLAAFHTSALVSLSGCACSALGISLAIIARAYLHSPWGVRASGEEPAELITTGPYAFVRHPIYCGMFLAMVGSALAQSLLWLLPLIVYGPHFIRSARREEELLLEEFPERYAGYMRRTKMLVPFVF
jgi:protein-S-isoprenylcysteine O-methyltransferase Ste14